MKLLALFLAVLTVAYLLPFSVFAEKMANDAVNRGKIEVSCNTEASYPSETNGRTTVGCTEFYNCIKLLDLTVPASITMSELFAFGKCYKLKEMIFETAYGWSADGKA